MKYKILSPFKDANGTHKPGQPSVELSDGDAEELVAIGAVELDEEESDPKAPVDPAERLAAIVDAIKQLNPDDKDLWLRDGKPDIPAIVAVTTWPITAAERNAAWESMQPKE